MFETVPTVSNHCYDRGVLDLHDILVPVSLVLLIYICRRFLLVSYASLVLFFSPFLKSFVILKAQKSNTTSIIEPDDWTSLPDYVCIVIFKYD